MISNSSSATIFENSALLDNYHVFLNMQIYYCSLQTHSAQSTDPSRDVR